MGYAEIADLRLRLSELYSGVYITVDGAPMDTEAQADLDAAAAEIDSFLGSRYVVPVSAPAVLPLLKSWAVTLAEELAWSRSGKPETPKGVADRVGNVRRMLQAIADGKQSLPGAEEKSAAEDGGGVALFAAAEPVFTRQKMKGF